MITYVFQKQPESFAFQLFMILQSLLFNSFYCTFCLWTKLNLKNKTAVNAKISVFVTCVEAIIYLLLYNLHDSTFNRSNETATQLFKEVFMHYLCKKLPWMWIWKVCILIKPNVSVPRHCNSVSASSMLLPKNVSNNFAKTMFFLRDITKIVSDQ